MTLLAWTGVFAVASLFWAWVVFGGGADWLDETGVISVLVGWSGMAWSAQGIRLYAGGTWALTGCWYVFGVFEPAMQTCWLL